MKSISTWYCLNWSSLCNKRLSGARVLRIALGPGWSREPMVVWHKGDDIREPWSNKVTRRADSDSVLTVQKLFITQYVSLQSFNLEPVCRDTWPHVRGANTSRSCTSTGTSKPQRNIRTIHKRRQHYERTRALTLLRWKHTLLIHLTHIHLLFTAGAHGVWHTDGGRWTCQPIHLL